MSPLSRKEFSSLFGGVGEREAQILEGRDAWVAFLPLLYIHCELRDKMFTFVYLHFSVWAVCVTVLPEVRDVMRLNYHVRGTLQNTLHH